MKMKQWIEKMKDREQWRLVVERPRLTQGCSAERRIGYSFGTNCLLKHIIWGTDMKDVKTRKKT